MNICRDCHHRPSGRTQEYGADCYCPCHDVADVAPDLLAACEAALRYIPGSEAHNSGHELRHNAMQLILRALHKAQGEIK
jgi:hypothetical protein